jgi:hypothetical protein
MQVQHGVGRHCGKVCFLRLSKVGVDEHAEFEEARIGNFDADLGGANGGVEDRADVADAAGEHFVGIGIDMNLRCLAELDLGDVVFKDVAEIQTWRGRRW